MCAHLGNVGTSPADHCILHCHPPTPCTVVPEGGIDEIVMGEQVTTPTDSLDLGSAVADIAGVQRAADQVMFLVDGCVDHPSLVTLGVPEPVCGNAGDRLYSWRAPFSSQPPNDAVPFEVQVLSAVMLENLDAFDVRIRSGFRSQTPSPDPNTYQPLTTHGPDSNTWQRGTIIPRQVEMIINDQGSVVISDSVSAVAWVHAARALPSGVWHSVSL